MILKITCRIYILLKRFISFKNVIIDLLSICIEYLEITVTCYQHGNTYFLSLICYCPLICVVFFCLLCTMYHFDGVSW